MTGLSSLKRKTGCEHRWSHWGRLHLGGLVGEAYTCQHCATVEVLVTFATRELMMASLEGNAVRDEKPGLNPGA